EVMRDDLYAKHFLHNDSSDDEQRPENGGEGREREGKEEKQPRSKQKGEREKQREKEKQKGKEKEKEREGEYHHPPPHGREQHLAKTPHRSVVRSRARANSATPGG